MDYFEVSPRQVPGRWAPRPTPCAWKVSPTAAPGHFTKQKNLSIRKGQKKIFWSSKTHTPSQPLGPPSLLFSGYWGLIDQSMKFSAHSWLVLKVGMGAAVLLPLLRVTPSWHEQGNFTLLYLMLGRNFVDVFIHDFVKINRWCKIWVPLQYVNFI